MSYAGTHWTPEEPQEGIVGELDRTPADVDPCVFCGREEARHRARTALWATVGIAGGLTLYGGLGYGVWRLFRLLVG